MVGILSLQGGFGLHAEACRKLGYAVREVKDVADLDGLAALILPGGESTTMGLLLERRALAGPLKAAIEAGLPTFGTCAGAILLACDIVGSDQFRLGTLDIAVERNAYGSQVDSFDTDLAVTGVLGLSSIPGVFIRAPRIVGTGPAVEVLARHGGTAVLVRHGTQVAATFHPELTESLALHRWFLTRVAGLVI
jgi:5'-phosphate synthase pdxT subunit